MHSEKKIIKYSLIAIITGLVGIYLASIYIEPQKVPLSQIDEKFLGKFVATEGFVKDSEVSNSSTLFMTIENNQSRIVVVQFGASGEGIRTGDFVLVKGEVSRYKGELELVAKDIRKL